VSGGGSAVEPLRGSLGKWARAAVAAEGCSGTAVAVAVAVDRT
jgi:hypothetical protein